MSDELLQYVLRIGVPAVALCSFLILIPKTEKLLRIFSLILLFILFRDAMTPVGLWTITSDLKLRFISQPITLWLLAVSSVVLAIFSRIAIGPIRDWNKRSFVESILFGLFAGFLIALMPFLFCQWIQCETSLKPEGVVLLLAIAALAYLGNTLEEVIFRGHLQNYLIDRGLSSARIIFISGGMFAVCHSFLAFTVTNAGWPILIFTFYEGVICASLRQRTGLLSAVLAHGTGLFLILSGALS